MNWHKPFGGEYRLNRDRVMFNAGAGPFNFTIYLGGSATRFVYVFAFGKRFFHQFNRKAPQAHG